MAEQARAVAAGLLLVCIVLAVVWIALVGVLANGYMLGRLL